MLKMSETIDICVDIMSEKAAAATESAIWFEEAFMAHHRTVYRVARSVVRDDALAEDVTQETFLRLYHHSKAIANDEMLKPWLIRVAINLAKNSVRGAIRANTREANYVKLSGSDATRSAADEYDEKAAVIGIVGALNEIREPLRSCLILKQQGLSYKEIAESLDLNERSIGTYVARARQEFARAYGAVQGGKR
jgi:RNA polymerase sigma-70 factor (ECF subfamily)